MKRIIVNILVFIPAVILFSCSEYNRALKSTNLDYKHDMAVMYYDQEEYYKALPLLEELVTVYRGTPNGEKLYYYLAYCNFYLGDLTMAGYYFESFNRVYPYSKYGEECLFLAAKCYYLSSPEYNLDQTNTYKAISEMQLFLNRYPQSRYTAECNSAIDELRKKLERKEFSIAALYLKVGQYKAAIVAFDILISDFPGTSFREEADFMSLKANYLLAVNSVEEKKEERLMGAIKKYRECFESNTGSRFFKDARSIYNDAQKMLTYVLSLTGKNFNS